MNQYIRKWAISLDGEKFIESGNDAQLRVVFEINVTPYGSQSTADIRLFNLSKETAIKQGSLISLSAGYVDNFDVIFVGNITNVFREREGPSIATRLLCRAGSPLVDRGSTSASYAPGTLLVDVIRDLARAWPRILIIDESQFSEKPSFPSGYVSEGDIPQVLDALGYQFGFDWIQERGSLVITRRGKERKTAVFEVNQYEGMVGVPEVSKGPDGLGVYVTTKINPFIKSNSQINVTSEFSTFNTGNLYIQPLGGDAKANGIYNVFSLRYIGDSHGDAWDLSIEALRPFNQSPGQSGAPSTYGGLVWGARVDQDFRSKVREISKSLRIDPNWIMSVIAFETGESFLPSQQNRAGGSAVGLIQFIPSTARALGTSTDELSGMTAVKQLDYVKKYYEPYASRIRNIGDAYMAVLWPAAIGKPDDWVMWEKEGKYAREYAQNSNLDTNRDGKITRGEAVSRVNRAYTRGLKYLR